MTEERTPPSSSLIERIGRVDLRVRNVYDSVDFYRDIVGLRVIEGDDKRAMLGSSEGTFLTLGSEGVDAPAARDATGLFHTAFRYPDRPALARALARLVAADIPIGAGDHGVSEALYIDDPDGNGVELYRDRPRSEWPQPGPGERVRMYTEPVDLDGLLSESDSETTNAVEAPPGTGVGHVHLQVGDVTRTVAFYTEGVGLDLMAQLGSQAAFFSSNGYHHHVGANTWNSRRREPAARNHAGLERVVFTTRDGSELDRLEDRLMGMEYTGDRRGDQLIVRDPDGIELEFATEKP